jgi:hypothetical protein
MPSLWMFISFFRKKKRTKEKLSAAPCSIKGCALAVSVVAEQDKADLGVGFVAFSGFGFRS